MITPDILSLSCDHSGYTDGHRLWNIKSEKR